MLRKPFHPLPKHKKALSKYSLDIMQFQKYNLNMHGIKRLIISKIEHLLNNFPVVAIIGARQVGKTTLLKQVMPDVKFFDLEKTSDFDYIKNDPLFFLSQHKNPIIIDEAQTLPELFPALKVFVDRNRDKNGQYLISGSSSPDLLNKINESLAGRIAVVELGGFSLSEAWGLAGSPLFEYIVSGQKDKLISLKNRITSEQLFKSCFLGSYPEPFLKHKNNPAMFSVWMENYLQAYIKRDIRNLFSGLDIQTFQRFVSMLAGSSGQILNYSDFARSLDVSQPTIKSYFQIAHGTFVWRIIQSYQKSIKKRIIKMPKGHLRDTGILNHILKNQNVESMLSCYAVGRIWETFIIEELIKGFNNTLELYEPFYYRTSNQSEIDLIIEGKFGVVPVEIKLGTMVNRKNLVAMQHFIEENNVDFGIIINNSDVPLWLSKNIIQIPAGCL